MISTVVWLGAEGARAAGAVVTAFSPELQPLCRRGPRPQPVPAGQIFMRLTSLGSRRPPASGDPEK